jgi:hypothetical protein
VSEVFRLVNYTIMDAKALKKQRITICPNIEWIVGVSTAGAGKL